MSQNFCHTRYDGEFDFAAKICRQKQNHFVEKRDCVCKCRTYSISGIAVYAGFAVFAVLRYSRCFNESDIRCIYIRISMASGNTTYIFCSPIPRILRKPRIPAISQRPQISYTKSTVIIHIQRFLNTVYDAKSAVDEDVRYSL